jgi:hypothetical protein
MLLGSHIERILREAPVGDTDLRFGARLPILGSGEALPEWRSLLRQIQQLNSRLERLCASYAAEYNASRASVQVADKGRLLNPSGRSRLASLLSGSEAVRERAERRLDEKLAALKRLRDLRVDRFAQMAGDLAGLIDRYNDLVPWEQWKLPRLSVADRLQWFCEQHPCLERGEDGTVVTVPGAVPAHLIPAPSAAPAPPAEAAVPDRRAA